MGDGTFDSVPSMFTQMHTIHVMHVDTSFPVAFALIEDKTTRSNEIVFTTLKNIVVVIRTFMSDFEMGSRNAIKNVNDGVCLKGCWFHYTQVIMRRVKKVCLQREYA